jgi:hypothetical protein
MPLNLPGLLPQGGSGSTIIQIPELWEFTGKNAIDLTTVVPGLPAMEGNPTSDSFAAINSYIAGAGDRKVNRNYYLPPGNWYHQAHLFFDDAMQIRLFGIKGQTKCIKQSTATTITATTNGSDNWVTFSTMTGSPAISAGLLIKIDGVPDVRQISYNSVDIDVPNKRAKVDGAIPPAVTAADVSYYKNEYSVNFRYAQGLLIESISFYGATTNTEINRFGEQGIIFGSCIDAHVNNIECFDYGDAGFRATVSGSRGEVDGSFYNSVRNSTFTNCSQVTNTPGGDNNLRGGCNYFLAENNKAFNLKGSFKISTRRQIKGGMARLNTIQCNKNMPFSCGFEVIGRNNLNITENTVSNAGNHGLQAYTPSEGNGNSYSYGNYYIADNDFINCNRGILMQNRPFPGDNVQVSPVNIKILNNRFTGVTDPGGPSVINFSNGGAGSTTSWGTGCECRDNIATGVVSGSRFAFQNVSNSGNTAS